MCNIFKTSDCKGKPIRICESRSYVLHRYGTFHVWFYWFNLRSFSALCKISEVKNIQTATVHIVSIQFQPNFMASIATGGNTSYYFSGSLSLRLHWPPSFYVCFIWQKVKQNVKTLETFVIVLMFILVQYIHILNWQKLSKIFIKGIL